MPHFFVIIGKKDFSPYRFLVSLDIRKFGLFTLYIIELCELFALKSVKKTINNVKQVSLLEAL